MPITLEILPALVGEFTISLSLTIKKITFIKRFVAVNQFSFPTHLPSVPFTFVILFQRCNWKCQFPSTMWNKLPCVHSSFINSVIFVIYKSFFGLKAFYFNGLDVFILFEIYYTILQVRTLPVSIYDIFTLFIP